jgi:hypothetical protein
MSILVLIDVLSGLLSAGFRKYLPRLRIIWSFILGGELCYLEIIFPHGLVGWNPQVEYPYKNARSFVFIMASIFMLECAQPDR